MKKTTLLLFLAFSTCFTVLAQEFESGTNVISANIGFGASYDNFAASQNPGYSINYERGIWDIPGPGVVSLGGYLGTKSYDYDFIFDDDDDKWTYTIVGVRGAYHYTGLNVENLDVYGGVMVSYSILSFDGNASGLNSRADGSVFVGGRWYFLESLAANVEAGYGVAFLTLGLSFRF